MWVMGMLLVVLSCFFFSSLQFYRLAIASTKLCELGFIISKAGHEGFSYVALFLPGVRSSWFPSKVLSFFVFFGCWRNNLPDLVKIRWPALDFLSIFDEVQILNQSRRIKMDTVNLFIPEGIECGG